MPRLSAHLGGPRLLVKRDEKQVTIRDALGTADLDRLLALLDHAIAALDEG